MKTVDEWLDTFEKEFPLYRWSLHNTSYIDGHYQGDGKKQLIIHSPISSGGGPKWGFVEDSYIECFKKAFPVITDDNKKFASFVEIYGMNIETTEDI